MRGCFEFLRRLGRASKAVEYNLRSVLSACDLLSSPPVRICCSHRFLLLHLLPSSSPFLLSSFLLPLLLHPLPFLFSTFCFSETGSIYAWKKVRIKILKQFQKIKCFFLFNTNRAKSSCVHADALLFLGLTVQIHGQLPLIFLEILLSLWTSMPHTLGTSLLNTGYCWKKVPAETKLIHVWSALFTKNTFTGKYWKTAFFFYFLKEVLTSLYIEKLSLKQNLYILFPNWYNVNIFVFEGMSDLEKYIS